MGRANILVVEDSFVVARRLQLSLERAGFSVEIARNGREACNKSRRKLFDIVITDERMPVMSGRELCRALREDQRYAETPVLFLTADPATLTADGTGHELGIAAVFEKPFHPEEILRWVENRLLSARAN